MREIDPQRKKIVVLCSSIAAMNGWSVLLKRHSVAIGMWIGLMAIMLIFALAQMARLKRQGR